ncbi:MAG: cold shock domain-containing protein [Bacilli bacterium]|nr:cold shock domain-containing protein [Bacilli bacterium]
MRCPLRGKVKWFNNSKGYGFIECSDLDDIFVHYSAINCEGYKTLNEGDIVDFRLVETQKGLQAIDVMSIRMTTA